MVQSCYEEGDSEAARIAMKINVEEKKEGEKERRKDVWNEQRKIR